MKRETWGGLNRLSCHRKGILQKETITKLSANFANLRKSIQREEAFSITRTSTIWLHQSAGGCGRRCLCRVRFRLRSCRGGLRRSCEIGTYRCRCLFSWWFEKAEREN